MRILYAERQRAHYVRDFLSGHPRIAIPLIVALLGTLSYAVFDPIREFFVKVRSRWRVPSPASAMARLTFTSPPRARAQAHVEGTFDTDRWAAISWLKRETLGRLGLTRGTMRSASTGIEKEREEAKEKMVNWLKDGPDTFIVVTGPKGSGKTALVDEVLEGGK